MRMAKVADRLGHYHSNLLYIRAREERMRWHSCKKVESGPGVEFQLLEAHL